MAISLYQWVLGATAKTGSPSKNCLLGYRVIFSSQKPPMTSLSRTSLSRGRVTSDDEFSKQEFGGSARPFTVPIDKIRASTYMSYSPAECARN